MITYPNAKINLGLHVLRRRSDGYHDIETLFVPCQEVHDILEIIPSDTLQLYLYGLPLDGMQHPDHGSKGHPGGMRGERAFSRDAAPAGAETAESNLCVKAWRLLSREFGIPAVQIHLYKGIPAGAGLGGGSADAAFTLSMLNELFSLKLTPAELASRAAILGSDCPFFLYNRPMLATGRGEILEPFDIDLSSFRMELSLPGIPISTREAYAGLRLPEEGTGRKRDSLREILKNPITLWKSLVVNDFESGIFAAHPEIAAGKKALYERGAAYASMTGSGSALFGLFPA